MNYLNKKSLFSTMVVWLLVLGPLIRIYATPVPGVNMYDLIMIVFVAISIIIESFRTIKLNSLFKFFLFACCVTVINTILNIAFSQPVSIDDIISRIFRWGLYCFLILWFVSMVRDENVEKKYITIAIIVSIILLVQIIAFYLFHVLLTFKIPGLELFGRLVDGEKIIALANRKAFRAYSVFLEPAHYGYYVLPALALSLFTKNKNYYVAIFLSICLLLSTSSSAIVLTAFIWIAYWVWDIKNNRNSFNLKKIILIAAMVVSSFLLFNTSAVQFGVGKIYSNETGIVYNNVRLNGFVSQIDLLSDVQKIFGIGVGNEEIFLISKGYDPSYMNSLGYLIFGIGYVGAFTYIIYMFLFFIKTKREYRIFILVFIISNLFSTMLFSSNLIVFLIW